MLQRWLGTVLLACEDRFRRVKGYAEITPVMTRIEAAQAEPQMARPRRRHDSNHGTAQEISTEILIIPVGGGQ